MSRLFFFFAAAAALRADSLEEILKRMDASAKTFKSVSASISQIDYTDALKESSENTGQMRLKRIKKGLAGILDFFPPDVRTYHFDGGKVEIYYPKSKTKEVYDVGKYQSFLDRAISLGFGTSGADLLKDYAVKLVGPERIQSTATTHLELSPKSAEVQKLVTRIDLWIMEGKSYPVQEKGLYPSKDYKIVMYSDVKITPPNSQLPDSDFELRVPKDVREIHPQK
ncbi:MAG TPA: hypothetical protein VNX18_02010 [Bryobacteraceae bacterium]|nr:hypothetical protein [Bryobacteraceae bacterium]